MRFGVLGPITVWAADGTPKAVLSAKVRGLLTDLLLHRGRALSAERLIDDLWGEHLPGNPSGALQAKVSQLRRALEDIEPGGRELIVYQPPGYLLQVEADAVDAGRFAALTAQARAADDPRAKARLLSDALALWRGPAYGEFGEEPFVRAASGRLAEERLDAVEEQAEARLALGEHGLLAGELGEAVSQYPLRERLRAVHMRALYRAGRQTEALEAYDDLRGHLAEELGLDPGHDLVALQQAILRQDRELDAAPGTPAAMTRPRTNLPAPLTELIGRDDAMCEVHARLNAGRLVTLTGPGGVGKTRLAVQSATRMAATFPDGVWLVELAALGCPHDTDGVDSLAEAVLDVLGIREDVASNVLVNNKPPAPLDRLAQALQGGQILLVLDNCERVVDTVAELAENLLVAVPGLRILATSREPLGLAGEALWSVPPLDVPSESVLRADGTAGVDPGSLERSTAVRLFVARAAATAPSFGLDASNAHDVGMLCRRLDGIPLALELAATRVRGLGVHEVLTRLDDRFRLLATVQRGVPARQQTLRAMIDWSWESLSEAEGALLRRLSVHAGGCTLAAAEAVSAGADLDAADVPYLIASLVDRSLVFTVDGVGGPRYRMLESVVDYGLERLDEAGERERVRYQHQRCYTELAERAEPHLHGRDQQRRLQQLDVETANLRSALDGAVADRNRELAVRLVAAMGWYWVLRGRLTEALAWLTEALSDSGTLPDSAEFSAARARAMTWQVGVAALVGDGTDIVGRSRSVLDVYDGLHDAGGRARAEWFLGYAMLGSAHQSASEDFVDRALAQFRELGDRWGTAAALSSRAYQAAGRGDPPLVERDGEQSLALFRELGDRWGQLQANDVLGWLAEINGNHDQATALHRDGLRIAEELGLWPDVSRKLSRLGRITMLAGDYVQADEFHERARKLAAEQSSKPAEHFAELGLGLAARRQGRLAKAQVHFENWVDWCRRMDWGPGLALILAELGFIAEQRGDAVTALALQLEGFAIARGTDDARAVALAWEGLAGAQHAAGCHRQAARLLGAGAAARELAGAPLPAAESSDVDRITVATREALGGQDFEAEYAHGAELGRQHVQPADLGVVVPPTVGGTEPPTGGDHGWEVAR